jgi:hypothetical protein
MTCPLTVSGAKRDSAVTGGRPEPLSERSGLGTAVCLGTAVPKPCQVEVPQPPHRYHLPGDTHHQWVSGLPSLTLSFGLAVTVLLSAGRAFAGAAQRHPGSGQH